MRKNKYGLIKKCLYCNNEFETKRRFLIYCSTPCKNPINRPGHLPWNKGIKLTTEQKAKLNMKGLEKGWGWCRGIPNENARQRFLTNNPNKGGRANKLRPKNPTTDLLKIYRTLVRRATHRTLKEMRINGEWVPKIGQYKHDWQIDHIIPHKQGFELGILPNILGSRKNIQFITGEENRRKWDKFQPMEIVKFIIGE